MQVCGQEFSTTILAQIKEVVAEQPQMSRRVLSRRVCEWLDWRASTGQWQEGSCRKALAKLHRRGVVTLPEVGRHYAFQRPRQACDHVGRDLAVPALCGSLTALGEVDVVPVSSRYCHDARIWRGLLEQHHYLGSGSLCGAQLRYVVKSARYGVLGALAFSAASWALRDRDRYIGWSDPARRANLRYVVANDRFLLVPTVRVANLASHVLALALRRLPEDWEMRYHVRPVLVETFVDPTRFDGACYKAANWRAVGQTAGRRDGIRKVIFVHALCDQWQGVLCHEPAVRLGGRPRREAPATWAEEEFGTIRLGDPRLKTRLFRLAQDFATRPQASIPEACGSKARTLGAYRLFQNEKVTMQVILTPHTEATIDRLKAHPVVLAPQDTTTLNYGTHPATLGLGPINNIANTAMGLLLHDTLAFTEDGTPLGILDAQCWAREWDEQGRSASRKERPLEQKESMKWLRSFRRMAEIQKLCPATMLVSIGDREADVYELFREAVQDPAGPKLLVRAEKSRNRHVEQAHLWEVMAGTALAGVLQIGLPRRGHRPAREAMVELRFAEVALTPPKAHDEPPLPVWAIYLREQEQGEPGAPIEWMLLTTVAVTSWAEAKQRVDWYARRWGIEVYHRTLKSGCRIKDRQLGTADRLETCLGVDMVVAWRIYYLTMLGREVPAHPCTVFFEDIEWKALCCYAAQTPEPPPEPPTLQQAIQMVGALGGHLGRKRDGMPGTECIWRGLQRLDTAVEMYAIFKQLPLPHIRQFYPYALLPPKGGP